nr:NAD(P)H-quinone oxidoreductase [Flaviflexus huanghaiensis]
MRAITDESLDIREVPVPSPLKGDVLIRVDFAGINRADLSQVAGSYPPPPGASNILGLEVSGHRVDTGERVMALLSSGGYADYVAVPGGQVMPVPDTIDQAHAAAIPESLATAWSNLADVLRVGDGTTVLIQGGSGSLGTIAVQLARELGATVIATAGGRKRCRAIEGLGATAVDHDDGLVEQVRELAPDGVDAILNIMGADVGELLPLLAVDGRIAVIALQGGAVSDVNLGRMMVKRLSIHGTTLRGRPTQQKESIVRAAADFALPRFADGRMTAHVAESFPLEKVAAAFAYVKQSKPFGKVILDVGTGRG